MLTLPSAPELESRLQEEAAKRGLQVLEYALRLPSHLFPHLSHREPLAKLAEDRVNAAAKAAHQMAG